MARAIGSATGVDEYVVRAKGRSFIAFFDKTNLQKAKTILRDTEFEKK